ncbi:hypothetical protein SAMN05444487_101256 [Marininema mesophilum]|uniref:Uncharacterized protein n=1 Tax=Marininema mesophilum TaxID=1048340 RepID=A0A1H2QMB6_9BACL|nr:hypothetical protein SAMN05444487_101256 [Marininema mesophilum]
MPKRYGLFLIKKPDPRGPAKEEGTSVRWRSDDKVTTDPVVDIVYVNLVVLQRRA